MDDDKTQEAMDVICDVVNGLRASGITYSELIGALETVKLGVYTEMMDTITEQGGLDVQPER